MLTENYKNRLQKLSGIEKSIIQEEVTLVANLGRSDKDTLSWFGEEYLLNLGSSIISILDNDVKKEQNLTLLMSKSSTKMAENTLVTKLIIQQITPNSEKIEYVFILTLNVQYEKNSNTLGTITFKGITNNFNLSSKHSKTDLDLFKQELINNILNTFKLETQVTKGK